MTDPRRPKVLRVLNDRCGVCLKETFSNEYMWNQYDFAIALEHPPPHLTGVSICADCYNLDNGPKMESLIHSTLNKLGIDTSFFTNTTGRVVMPNGTDGLICRECNEFCPYVEPNQKDGSYICKQH